MLVRLGLLLLLLLPPAFAGEAVPRRPGDYTAALPWPFFSNFRFQRGDDPRWADPKFDDSQWERINGRALPSRDGIYWVRWRVAQRDAERFHTRDGLLVKVVASYELYWDGKLIGRNGRVGASPDEEQPGVVDALFQIPPDQLGLGEHVVALRISSFHTGFPQPTYGLLLGWGNFRTMLVERARTAILSLVAVGAALVGSIVFGLMWLLASRRLPLLIFSVMLLCVALMQALQAWRWLFEYPYPWHYPRLVTITILVTAMAVLLPAFVMFHYRVGRARWFFPIMAGLLTWSWTISPIYNYISLHATSVGFAVALGFAVRAVWRRRRGAWVACLGLAFSVLALFVAPREFLEHAFFLSAGPGVLGLLVALVLELRDERREAQQAVLSAARMEIELLKKNIQPHFLVNTLATIVEVIEQEPRRAVTMIEALAGEFRILAGVSGEKLIPLEQELELCRAHLEVMSLRKGARCSLTAQGVEPGAQVPPALFHTLIENGLTHLMPRNGRLEFDLRADRLERGVRYTLLARGERQAGADARPAGEGTGLRYVKARLEESFTGAWTLASVPVPEGWETMIEIRSPDALPRPVRAAAEPAGVPQQKPA